MLSQADLAVTKADRRLARSSVGRLLLIAVAMGASLAATYMFNGVQDSVKTEMHLTDLDLSLVEGVAVAIPLAVFGVPLGFITDRVNRTRMMAIMALLWAVAAIGTAWSPNLPVLFVMRVLAATAGSAMFITSISLAADLSRLERRGRAMLVVNLAKIISSAIALPLGTLLMIHFSRRPLWPLLGVHQPWRAAHLALAACGAVFAAALAFVREPARRGVEAGVNASVRVVLGELWLRRGFLGPLAVGQIGMLMADLAASIWATPLLIRNFGLRPLSFTGWLAFAMLFGGIAGSFVGAISADVGLRKGRGGIMVGAVVASAIAVPAALFSLLPTAAGVISVLGLLLFCGTVASMALLAVVGAYLPNETRGLALGIFQAVAGLIGFGVAPTLVVGASNLLGGESKLGPALAIVNTLIGLVAAASLVLAMRRTPPIVAVEDRLEEYLTVPAAPSRAGAD